MSILKYVALGAFALPVASYAQISDDVVKIGQVSDLSGIYVDVDGPGGTEAIRMAIEDFGGQVNGKKIELVTFDHQNKTDLATGRAREWLDRNGVDMIFGNGPSAIALAVSKISADKKKPFFSNTALTTRLTNEDCNAYTVHYAYDTKALAKVSADAIVKNGGKNWYFLALDTAFGESAVKDTSVEIQKSGGKVIGVTKHPAGVSDFSSFLLQAKNSGASVLGLASSGSDAVNALKGIREFGISKSMTVAPSLIFIADIHALGLRTTQGLQFTESWYWDMNEKSRAWAQRFFQRTKKMPNGAQAAQYSATLHYLNAVKAAGSDDGDKVMEKMKSAPINDMYATDGRIRPDGRMVHDMYLVEVKKPEESKAPWDYYKVVSTIRGENAFTPKSESRCSIWK